MGIQNYHFVRHVSSEDSREIYI